MFIKSNKWLKRISSLAIFILSQIVALSGCQPSEPIYQPGTYINEAEGYYSTLIVAVEVDDKQIIDIRVVAHEEPEILSEIVFGQLPPMMKKKNTNDVDVISGATYTSRALIEAVGIALEQAREALE